MGFIKRITLAIDYDEIKCADSCAQTHREVNRLWKNGGGNGESHT